MKPDPDDSEEVLEIFKTYDEDAAFLLARIEERDRLKSLLRVAQPSKMAKIRHTIAQFDKLIETSELCLEHTAKKIALQRKADRHYLEIGEMIETMRPEFLKYIAENHPKQLEKIKAIFENNEDE